MRRRLPDPEGTQRAPLRQAAPWAMMLLPLLFASCATERQEPPGQGAQASDTQAVPATEPPVAPDSILRPNPPLVPTPEVIRGLYVNRWAAIGRKMWELIGVARRTEINALVIDVKDDRGFVLYRSRVPLAREIGADTQYVMTASRLRAVLDTMRAHDVYPIARIVVAKDPLLAAHRADLAIKRRDDVTKPWLDKNGRPWLDPHQDEVWTYAADLGREAVDLGFSEVQLDYVRFPDEPGLHRDAAFPLANGRPRAQVIREQIGATRAALASTGAPLTIDVFGLTTSDTTDMGIGQRWEAFIDQADAVLPMTYPSHYAPGSYGISNPNANPYAVIDRAMRDARGRTTGVAGAGTIIPWYQDFTLGPPRYGVDEVRAQIQAGYDNGFPSWILWNPRSVYTLGALRPDGEERTKPAAVSTNGAERPKPR